MKEWLGYALGLLLCAGGCAGTRGPGTVEEEEQLFQEVLSRNYPDEVAWRLDLNHAIVRMAWVDVAEGDTARAAAEATARCQDQLQEAIRREMEGFFAHYGLPRVYTIDNGETRGIDWAVERELKKGRGVWSYYYLRLQRYQVIRYVLRPALRVVAVEMAIGRAGTQDQKLRLVEELDRYQTILGNLGWFE
ncbi:MAG: hypothetical protein A3F84_02610 [Candidatus Handelsmanbacteria bacterium RIFCSPLOWO2_12_FULL_64_10]|uniref:Uncharacterized protein n=1 Tax=Handelsmanbacteria sp. (strain RIFCSPLOWO2_12_FULL_64_10) TaxID=1817868 RepID=A0A1F6CLG8_HANXR|nr:MAG: hypothetical protein A3F84_02610 [Candidatus Handelsmanbacteria bacterium RIFCSPLOWO2_12_FULL_64_10]